MPATSETDKNGGETAWLTDSNNGLYRVAEKLKSFDIGIACLLGCLYFLAVPLTITVNDSGNSMLKLLTLPIGGYLAVSLFFYRKSIELNLVHLGAFLYLLTIDGDAVCGRKAHLRCAM